MSALICDICGGNLVMDETGEFAKCESCGMKHSKERVKAKVQEIKGVVEITKGEAEKERLLKNAETYLQLGETYKAEKMYEQITNEYPDEWRGWFELAKMEFSKLPVEVCYSECAEFDLPIKYMDNFKFKECKRKCIILNPKSENEFIKIIDKHNGEYKQHLQEYEKSLKSDEENIKKYENIIKQNDFKFLFSSEYLNTSKSVKLEVEQILAKKVNDELKAKGKSYKLINIINIGKDPSGIDNRHQIKLERIDIDSVHFSLREVIELKYLCTTSATFKGIFEWGQYTEEALKTIYFPTKYTIEELLDELMKPTCEEQRVIWKEKNLCELCGSELDSDNFCVQCQFINPELIDAKIKEISALCEKFPDQFALYFDIKNNNPKDYKYVRYDTSVEHLFEDECENYYKYDHRDYLVYVYRERSFYHKDVLLNSVCIELYHHGHTYPAKCGFSVIKIDVKLFPQLIKFLRQREISKKCQYCGGEFIKNIFSRRKICSKCGRNKDY